jgi:hypothetical protein
MNKLIAVILYIYSNPGAEINQICHAVSCSHATFYRLRNTALSILCVDIQYINGYGYRIISYGLINRTKLNERKK